MNEAYDEETDERAAKASGSTTIDRFEQSRTSVVSHRQVTVTYPARASVRFPGLRHGAGFSLPAHRSLPTNAANFSLPPAHTILSLDSISSSRHEAR